MYRVVLCAFCITLCLIGTLAVPVPVNPKAPVPAKAPEPAKSDKTDHKPGEYVGVRSKAYENRDTRALPGVSQDKIPIHPAVVLDGLDPETGTHSVAMISKHLPNDPPQKNIKIFHPEADIYGNVALSPPKHVTPAQMKPWVNPLKEGVIHSPMDPSGLESLKEAMAPHTGWRPPPPTTPPPPPPRLPGSHRPQPANGVSRNPSGRPVNAHASGSRHPASGSSSYRHGASSGSYRGGTHPTGGYGGSSSRQGSTGYGSSRSHTDSSRSRPPPPGS